jgi:hypothetical protein
MNKIQLAEDGRYSKTSMSVLFWLGTVVVFSILIVRSVAGVGIALVTLAVIGACFSYFSKFKCMMFDDKSLYVGKGESPEQIPLERVLVVKPKSFDLSAESNGYEIHYTDDHSATKTLSLLVIRTESLHLLFSHIRQHTSNAELKE